MYGPYVHRCQCQLDLETRIPYIPDDTLSTVRSNLEDSTSSEVKYAKARPLNPNPLLPYNPEAHHRL